KTTARAHLRAQSRHVCNAGLVEHRVLHAGAIVFLLGIIKDAPLPSAHTAALPAVPTGRPFGQCRWLRRVVRIAGQRGLGVGTGLARAT
ncbi:MAG: hypothetical protein RJA34_377, partial [Pseudomonadota bacterium]